MCTITDNTIMSIPLADISSGVATICSQNKKIRTETELFLI